MTNRKVAKTKTTSPSVSKRDRCVALLRREGGASIAEIVEATGWQAHSARAMLTGLRKQGYEVNKTKADGVTRYAVTAGVPA